MRRDNHIARDVAIAQDIFLGLHKIFFRELLQARSCMLGEVGTRLYFASQYLDHHLPTQNLNIFLEKLNEALTLLASLCLPSSFSKAGDSLLYRLEHATKELDGAGATSQRVRERLLKHDKEHQKSRTKRDPNAQQYDFLTRLNEALKIVNSSLEIREDAPKKISSSEPNDYPIPINSQLYHTLERYSHCRCSDDSDVQHFTRLCLQADISEAGEDVLFNMIFSGYQNSRREPSFHWQQIRLLLSRKKHGPKGQAKFADDDQRPWTPTAKELLVPEDAFCTLLNDYRGPRWICVKVKGERLFQLPDPVGSEEFLARHDSISLKEALRHYHLSAKMRLVLAYILAHSVWRYYNSDWMKSPWSTDSIHFLKEEVGMSFLPIYACKPCLAVRFGDSQNEVSEFNDRHGIVHRFPRLLALGNMLVELGRQRPFETARVVETAEEQINNDFTTGFKTIKTDVNWPYFGLDDPEIRGRYRELTGMCFKKGVFLPEQDVETRRALLHKGVVAPLEQLLEDMDWKKALTDADPMSAYSLETQLATPNTSKIPLSIGSALGTGFLESSRQTSGSKQWLEAVQKLHFDALFPYYDDIRDPSHRRIRIAVLDTGYDPDAEFFQARDRKGRLKAWKDYVGGVSTPQDEDGHGSMVLSLVMKVAPYADISVARIARNSEGLKQASNSISEAITWAVKHCGVDIITIAFGVGQEQAQSSGGFGITEVVSHRGDRVLFFAAAGNEGANIRHAMFPASHGLVIPIYGTDSNGTFLDELNPRMRPDEAAIFGTLAKDVPCAGRSSAFEVYPTGTSFATAIAAGLAAMILEYVQILERRKQHEHREPLRWKDLLSTRRGMIAMFTNIARSSPDRRYYLQPVHFFQKPEYARDANIISVVDDLQQ